MNSGLQETNLESLRLINSIQQSLYGQTSTESSFSIQNIQQKTAQDRKLYYFLNQYSDAFQQLEKDIKMIQVKFQLQNYVTPYNILLNQIISQQTKQIPSKILAVTEIASKIYIQCVSLNTTIQVIQEVINKKQSIFRRIFRLARKQFDKMQGQTSQHLIPQRQAARVRYFSQEKHLKKKHQYRQFKSINNMLNMKAAFCYQ